MDVKKFAVAATATLHLRDANDELMFATDEKGNKDEGRPMRVVLFGPGSKEYARAQAAQNNRMVDKLKSRGKASQTAEQQTAEKAVFLAAITESMENVEYDALTGRELAIAVYSDESLGFIPDQVSKFIGEWGNFSKGSPKT